MGRGLSSTKVTAQVNTNVQNTLDSGKLSTSSIVGNISKTLASGLGDSEADRAWSLENSELLNGNSLTIRLSDFNGLDIGAGSGNDALGQALTLDNVTTFLVVNENAVTALGELEIEGGDANPSFVLGDHTNSTLGSLLGQGFLFKHQEADDGFSILSGAADTIKLTAINGDVVFSVYILGRSDTETSSSSSSSQSLSSVSCISTSSSPTSGSSSSSTSSISISCASTSSVSSSSQSSVV